jgi:hypothetical protein
MKILCLDHNRPLRPRTCKKEEEDYILFNPVASTIPKWQTFKLLTWVQLLNRLVDLDEILYGGDGIEY